MTAAATAYCASNPIVYVQLVPRKSPGAPILRLAALSSSSSTTLSHETPTKAQQRIDNDETIHPSRSTISRTTITDTSSDINDHHHQTLNDSTIEQILAGVGLRRKTTKTSLSSPQRLRPLTKRLAVPVCLLPLKTNIERVRQALFVVLPYLKFLSITHDTESFCLTDARIFIESLPSRSSTQMRSVLTTTTKTTTTTMIKRKTKRHLISKADFVSSAGDYLHQKTTELPMNKHVRSALNCQVVLNRLDEFAIDQIMKNATESNGTDFTRSSNRKVPVRSTSDRSKSTSSNTRTSLDQTTTKTTTTCTTITTLTTKKTTVKEKSTRASFQATKRLKVSNDDCIVLSDSHSMPSLTSSSLSPSSSYQRIYLKCFICSKRQYIDAKLTTSDTLHLHWLEHGNDLSLNIYDSIIDSILTRVVEFFHFPKQHKLEGKIQTVFILNSEEVRRARTSPLTDDTCIVLD